MFTDHFSLYESAEMIEIEKDVILMSDEGIVMC